MKRYYFLSDAHLGSRLINDPKAHEGKLVAWLDQVKEDAKAIFLVGDIFDFWFEYRYVVPKGYTLLLGKLRELTSSGLDIHFFIGNHDLWTFGYLEQEVGLIVHKEPLKTDLLGTPFYITHGDGLGDNSLSFKLLRKIFHNKTLQWMFRNLVPTQLGLGFGYAWSAYDRKRHDKTIPPYLGPEKEHLMVFAREAQKTMPQIKYYVFGHRHILLNEPLNQSKVIILGDFMRRFSYGVWDGKTFELKKFQMEKRLP